MACSNFFCILTVASVVLLCGNQVLSSDASIYWLPPAPPGCDEGWQGYLSCPEGQDNCLLKCFTLLLVNDTAADRSAECTNVRAGAILAEPKDESDFGPIMTQVAEMTGFEAATYIGINDRDVEGTFVYDSDGSAVPVGLLNWNVEPPTNDFGDEDCVVVVEDLVGNNSHIAAAVTCTDSGIALRFACQYDVEFALP